MGECHTEKYIQKMLLCDVGVSERDRRGWKLGSPLLEDPGEVASKWEGDSAATSSGSGGAPGSPGLGRLEEVEDGAALRLAPATGGRSPHFCNEGKLRELARSEVAGLRSPSGWNRRVELFEKALGRSAVVVRVLKLLSEDELEATAATSKRDTIKKEQESNVLHV